MIKKHSDDPDVAAAAAQGADIVHDILNSLSPAEKFNYGGHELTLNEYNTCADCTVPIAEAQQASQKLAEKAATLTDPTLREHVGLAAQLLRLEADAAEIRARFHNGRGSEVIINELLGFIHNKKIHDRYEHSHRVQES